MAQANAATASRFTCGICSEPHGLLGPQKAWLPCKHKFGHSCLLQWLRTSRSCPHCHAWGFERDVTTEEQELNRPFAEVRAIEWEHARILQRRAALQRQGRRQQDRRSPIAALMRHVPRGRDLLAGVLAVAAAGITMSLQKRIRGGQAHRHAGAAIVSKVKGVVEPLQQATKRVQKHFDNVHTDCRYHHS